MPRVIRIGVDHAQDHGYSPLGTVESGSTNVFTNNIETARLTDPYTPVKHCKGDPCHTIGEAAEGSVNVFVNNLPIHRDGDRVSCGTVADNGSSNVFANSKDETVPDPDLYGDDPFDTGGYAISLPEVMYPPSICAGPATGGISNWQYIDELPWDGTQNAGWTWLWGEASLPDLKNYDGIGVIDPPPQLDPSYAIPIDLTYEEGLGPKLSTVGLALDPDTGRIYGDPTGYGIFNIRCRHHYYDDDGDGLPGTPSAWVQVQISDC